MAVASKYTLTASLLSSWLIVGGCARSEGSNSTSAPGPSGSALPTAATAADLRFCVEETNRYRASVGVGALSQSSALESYAATGARVDGVAHAGHSHFNSTNGGGVALAENLIPWWPLADYGTVQEVMRQGLAKMWAEGPGGPHYQNMAGRYTQVGCGVYIGNGEITVVQDLR